MEPKEPEPTFSSSLYFLLRMTASSSMIIMFDKQSLGKNCSIVPGLSAFCCNFELDD